MVKKALPDKICDSHAFKRQSGSIIIITISSIFKRWHAQTAKDWVQIAAGYTCNKFIYLCLLCLLVHNQRAINREKEKARTVPWSLKGECKCIYWTVVKVYRKPLWSWVRKGHLLFYHIWCCSWFSHQEQPVLISNLYFTACTLLGKFNIKEKDLLKLSTMMFKKWKMGS